MKLLTTFLATLLLIISSPAQESPELKEAADLTDSVIKLFKEQKYAEALPLAKRALEIREKLLPRNDPRIGSSLTNLGEVYVGKRDFGKAMETFQRLLQHQTELFGPEDVTLAPTLERLGVLYFRQGDSDKAEDAFKQAVALKEKSLGADNVQVAQPLFNLAELYRSRRDFDRAAAAFRRTLQIYGKHSGVSSADYERVSDVYSCVGYETKNDDIFKDVKAIWKQFATPAGITEAPAANVLNGRAISLPRPSYPERAREGRLSGYVVVKVKIDETGKVVDAKDMCQGPPYLSQSSVKAAYEARFTPTKLSGKPVPVYGVIQYNFVRR